MLYFHAWIQMVQFDFHIFFKMGWFNHQLDGIFTYMKGWFDGEFVSKYTIVPWIL